MVRVIILLVLLSGCSTLDKLSGYGAEANDEALRSSKFMICKGASIGAVMREFNTKEKAEGWVKICLGEKDAIPLVLEITDGN